MVGRVGAAVALGWKELEFSWMIIGELIDKISTVLLLG
jgi:hypothetical protein